MKENKKKAILKIAELLDKENILWALGASSVLYFYGLVHEPTDIDILVNESQLERALELLSTLGEMEDLPKTPIYQTRHFYTLEYDGVQVEVICGFEIQNHGFLYQYDFNEDSVKRIFFLHGVRVPTTSLEEWFVLYYMIPNREEKVSMIRSYLGRKGLNYPKLLLKMRDSRLPKDFLEEIDELIRKENL